MCTQSWGNDSHYCEEEMWRLVLVQSRDILDEKNKLLHKYKSLIGNNEPEEVISKVKQELKVEHKHAKDAIFLRWYAEVCTVDVSQMPPM